jgi:hypothetical protein
MDPITILAIGAVGLFLLKKKQDQDNSGSIPLQTYPDGTPSAGNATNVSVNPDTGAPVETTTPNPDAPDVPNQQASSHNNSQKLSERLDGSVYPDNDWLIALLQRAEAGGDSFTPVKEQIQADIQTYQNRPVLVAQYQELMNQVNQEETDQYNY